MKNSILTATAAMAVAGLALAASPADAVTINQRQHSQQARIAQGLVSGQLTAREAARLEAWQASIARQEAHMRATGGGLGPRERWVLHERLDNASAAIWRQKHDRQRKR